jgi:hypothetical protein
MNSNGMCFKDERCVSCRNKPVCSHHHPVIVKLHETLRQDMGKIEAELAVLNAQVAFDDEDAHRLNILCEDAKSINTVLGSPWRVIKCDCGGDIVLDDDRWASRKHCDRCSNYDDMCDSSRISYLENDESTDIHRHLDEMLSFWGMTPTDIVNNVGTIWFTDAKTQKQYFITIGECEVDYRAPENRSA